MFITKRRLNIIKQEQYEKGMRLGWELHAKSMHEGVIVSRLDRDIEEVLKGKGIK